jgi:hypothetical protein
MQHRCSCYTNKVLVFGYSKKRARQTINFSEINREEI